MERRLFGNFANVRGDDDAGAESDGAVRGRGARHVQQDVAHKPFDWRGNRNRATALDRGQWCRVGPGPATTRRTTIPATAHGSRPTPSTARCSEVSRSLTTYYWQIRARNAGGTTEADSGTWWTFTTGQTVLQPPTGLTVWSIVGNTVTLRWSQPTAGPAPTGYVLEGGLAPQQVLGSMPTGSTAPVFTLTLPSGVFYVRMHSLAGPTRSISSNEVRLVINAQEPPSPPANLLGTANGSSLALAWRNTFTGGNTENVTLDVTGTFTTSRQLGSTESFNFNGVPPGTYTFTVRAGNSVGASGPSNAITLTFPAACTGPPGTPVSFLAYSLGSTIHLMWQPAATGPAPTSYQLVVTGAISVNVPTSSRSLSGTVGPGTYSINVVAVNTCGASAPSPVRTIVMP